VSDAPPGSPEPVETSSPTTTASPRPDQTLPPATGERRGEGKERKDAGLLSFLSELPVLIVMAFVLALLIKTFLVQAFYIPSGSMEPTLMPGDRVLVNKVVYRLHDPGRGDIIVFENPHPVPEQHRNPVSAFVNWLTEGLGFTRPPDEDFIKRVIGLPGETVEYRRGAVYIDGERLDEPYLQGLPKDTRAYPPTKVPEGKLFVMGDNRLNSNDSRFGLGFVPIDKVVGRAFVVIWPPSDVGWLRG